MTRRDQAAFVGREAELALIGELFVDDPPASILLVHGPGGIGKSALLREVARRGREAGWSPVLVEGRDLPPIADAIENALAPAHKLDRPLILIDTYERMAALGAHLRNELLPDLPDRAIVIIAGRRAPDRGWFEGGWETIALELELGPLTSSEARELLESQGLRDADRRGELAGWAGGSPLALTLAAGAADDPAWEPGEDGEVVRGLVRRLVDAEVDGLHRDVLGVASVARVTSVDLLRDVLPDVDAEAAMRWLEERTFTEPLGGGLTCHELVRRALRADIRQREPERDRELRLRIADSLYARAIGGRPILTVDLAELVETPVLRSFYSWEGSVRNRVDSLRAGDAEQVALLLGAQGKAPWWEATRTLFEQAPEIVAIARDAGDALCGFAISVTPASAPPAAEADPVLGPVLRHAREHIPDGNAILWRDATDFTRGAESRLQAMINMAGVLRSALQNPRYAYLPVDPELTGLHDFLAALGARHIHALDVPKANGRQEFHLVDYGPRGLLGAQRDMVYLELGVAAPTADAPASQSPPVDTDVVRQALRDLRLPHALAQSPLATGDAVEQPCRLGPHAARARRRARVRRRRERAPAAPGARARLPRPRSKPRAGRRRAEPEPRRVLSPAQARLRTTRRVRRRIRPTLSPTVPSGPAPILAAMSLCFIEPQDAIRVMAESLGREARRQLLGEVVRAWVDEIPEDELQNHYAKAVEELDEDDLSMLAAWHASLEVGRPIANKEFLLQAFPRLGEHQREALKIAAGFKGDDAFEAGVSEEQALDTVLPWLSRERLIELATEAVELYCWDRLGSDN